MKDTNIVNKSSFANSYSHNDIVKARPDQQRPYNICFLFMFLLTVSFGTIQFGYSIGSWNTASDAYLKRAGKEGDDVTHIKTVVQTITTLGSAFGALGAGPLLAIGRWNCLMITNVIVIVGCSLTLVDNLISLYIGRFMYGVAAGCFSVFCPKFISELAPKEISGPAGALSQICVTFGILIPFTIGLAIGDVDDLAIDSFEIQYYWYILFGIPLVMSLIQVLLLLTVFRYDTPIFLKQKGEFAKLRQLMGKVYRPQTVQERIEELNQGDQEEENGESIGYGSVCCGSKYKRATFVGCSLAIFQQLTGINIIMFYSNTIFDGSGMDPTVITALIGAVNFVATLGGLGLLASFGRKTIMFYCSIIMAILLAGLGYCSLIENNTGMIILLMSFIAIFEFSSGPITWLYMAEIMQDKGSSIATVMNWLINLIISAITPLLVKEIGAENIGYIFISVGGLTMIGAIYISMFMKETKGKTKAEIEEIFCSESNSAESNGYTQQDTMTSDRQ